jgi:hypothetical protein
MYDEKVAPLIQKLIKYRVCLHQLSAQRRKLPSPF